MSAEKLIVFVKAPRPGLVKTRLAAAIGKESAVAAYRTLVEATLNRLATFDGVELRFAPDDSRAEMEPWLQRGWSLAPQGAGELGERMARAFGENFVAGCSRAVIVGSDCPDIEAADVRAAWRELETHDVVVGPATDGGYWLIGLRAPQPELFRGVAWSSDQVLAQTLQRAKQLGLRVQLLRILSDVDTLEDWEEFRCRQH